MDHIMDILPKFQGMIELIEDIRKEVTKKSGISNTSQDARMVALDSLQASILSTGMWVAGFNSLTDFCMDNSKFNKDKFLFSVRSGVDIEKTEALMLDELRLGFMTQIHFRIDNLFHNLLRHLDSLPKRTGYWNLTNAILKECSMPTDGDEKERLTAFANLRNSLHANGIHRTNTLKIEFEEMNFDFIKDQKVECASWAHIITLLKGQVEILKSILLSEKILNIKKEIKDDFSAIENADETT